VKRMKVLSPVLLLVALLTFPVGGATTNFQIDRSPIPNRPYPTIQQNQSRSISNEERILLLEQESAQQDAAEKALDDRMTQHVDDIFKSQGFQTEQINQLESRLEVVYRFGALIAFVLTLSVPFFLWIMNRAQSHNRNISTSISTLMADVQEIKIVANIRNASQTGRRKTDKDNDEDTEICLT